MRNEEESCNAANQSMGWYSFPSLSVTPPVHLKQRDESRRREGDQRRPESTTVHLISLYHAPLPVCLQLPHQHFQRRAKFGLSLEERGVVRRDRTGKGLTKTFKRP